jgi:hypothetical protein
MALGAPYLRILVLARFVRRYKRPMRVLPAVPYPPLGSGQVSAFRQQNPCPVTRNRARPSASAATCVNRLTPRRGADSICVVRALNCLMHRLLAACCFGQKRIANNNSHQSRTALHGWRYSQCYALCVKAAAGGGIPAHNRLRPEPNRVFRWAAERARRPGAGHARGNTAFVLGPRGWPSHPFA